MLGLWGCVMLRVVSKAVAAAVAAAAVLLPASVHAQASDFFKGKTVTIYIGTPVGGGYDLYGRLLARHLGRHLPGHPNVVASNMPGGTGIICANYIYSVAPKDGTAIAIIIQSMGEEQGLGTEGVRFDVTKFNWLGRVTSNVEMNYTWHASPTKTVEDAQNRQTIMASAGPASITYPLLLNSIIGTQFKLVRGYLGTQNAHLAMQRGEVDGTSSSYNTVKTLTDWLMTKQVNVLVQYAPRRHRELPNVRTIGEFAKTPEDVALFRFLTQASDIGRSFVAPPGVSLDRVELLRAAFDATMSDPQFVSELKQARAEFDPLSGKDLQQMVAQRTALSPANKQRVHAARRE